MAITITLPDRARSVFGNRRIVSGTLAFDSSYTASGESLTASDLGLSDIDHIVFGHEDGLNFDYDSTNEVVKVYGLTKNPILVTDDDSAATNGVAIYLHIADTLTAEGTRIGHIESVTAGNADTHITLVSGGPAVQILDDDAAATAGIQLYWDEDGTGGRILGDLDGLGDVDAFVMASDGSFIRIEDDDSASTNGVALYVDDDAANSYERLLAVAPGDADGYAYTDNSVGLNASTEASALADLSGVTALSFQAWGR